MKVVAMIFKFQNHGRFCLEGKGMVLFLKKSEPAQYSEIKGMLLLHLPCQFEFLHPLPVIKLSCASSRKF